MPLGWKRCHWVGSERTLSEERPRKMRGPEKEIIERAAGVGFERRQQAVVYRFETRQRAGFVGLKQGRGRGL
jgi:hypothetical protein